MEVKKESRDHIEIVWQWQLRPPDDKWRRLWRLLLSYKDSRGIGEDVDN